MTTETNTAAAELAAAMTAAGVALSYTFVPQSQSRNKGLKARSLNWLATVTVRGRPVLTTDYMAGSGHCPAYQLSVKEAGGRDSIMRDEMIKHECETGRTYHQFGCGGTPILPSDANVMASLLLDASALDAPGFEDWAADYGYDTDSRKAGATYRACLEIGLKLRAALGDAALAKMRELAQEL